MTNQENIDANAAKNNAEQSKNITHLTCIICPMGCQLEVKTPEGYNAETARSTSARSTSAFSTSAFSTPLESFTVTGNACPRGEAYAKKEMTTPERTLTCTVAVTGGNRPLVSAKTAGEVPKAQLLGCMQVVRRITVNAPIQAGQVLAYDILHTGINLIACENVAAV